MTTDKLCKCILGWNLRDQDTQGSKKKKQIKSIKLLNQALLSHFQQETNSGYREVGEQWVAGLERVRGRKIMTILARIPCYGLPCSKHSCVQPPGQQAWDLCAIICSVPKLWIKKPAYKSSSTTTWRLTKNCVSCTSAEKQVMRLPGWVSAQPLPSLCGMSRQLHAFVTSSLFSSQPVSLCA